MLQEKPAQNVRASHHPWSLLNDSSALAEVRGIAQVARGPRWRCRAPARSKGVRPVETCPPKQAGHREPLPGGLGRPGADGECLGRRVQGDDAHIWGTRLELAHELTRRPVGRQRDVEHVEAAVDRRNGPSPRTAHRCRTARPGRRDRDRRKPGRCSDQQVGSHVRHGRGSATSRAGRA